MKKWFENALIEKKLRVGFLLIAFLGVLIGVVGIISMISNESSQQRS
jgi:hypothetical protein